MPTARRGIVTRGVCSSSKKSPTGLASGNTAVTAGVTGTLSVPTCMLCHPILEGLQSLVPTDDEHLAAAPYDAARRQLLQRCEVFVFSLGLDRYPAPSIAQ